MALVSFISIKAFTRWVVLVMLAMTLVIALLATQPASAATSTSAATPTASPTPSLSAPKKPTAPSGGSGGIFGFLGDPRQWAADVFDKILSDFIGSLSQGLHDLIESVLDSSLNFITQTPAVGSYNDPTVQTLWNVMRLAADGGLVLVTVWGGFNVMAREHLHAPYHEAMELVPRLILGALLVNTSLTWGRLAIDANNALCQAIGQTSLPAWGNASHLTQILVDIVATFIYLIMGLLLLLQMLMRLALVDVLLVAAPLGLLCWVLPQTQGWARLWSHTFTAAVFTQFVQVLALKLGGSLVVELTPLAPASALLTLFLGIAVLALTLKIPHLLRTHVGGGIGVAGLIVYRQATHVIADRSRRANSPEGAA